MHIFFQILAHNCFYIYS